MPKYRKLTHAIYRCEYHLVFVPKYRYRVLVEGAAQQMEHDIRAICSWRDVEVMELSVQPDHVHLVCSIPPKIAVSDFVGLLKGKLAIKMFKSYPTLRKLYWGNRFWARGYFVTTVGVDEELVRRYVRFQEEKEKQEERQRKNFDLFPDRDQPEP